MIKTEFMQLLEELDSINEAPLKNYRIVYYEDEVKKSFTVQAASKEEAEQIGWSKVDADSLYVSEEINEATDKAASKAFWAAAKKGQIDDVSFHAAYDDELRELGLLDLFNSDGGFTSRSVYGRIKEAKDAENKRQADQKKEAETLKKSILEDDKVFGDLVVDKNQRKKMFYPS
jgi:hypothetical protein